MKVFAIIRKLSKTKYIAQKHPFYIYLDLFQKNYETLFIFF